VQRPDDKKTRIFTFIKAFNDFSEEYPDMRKQAATKDELHQRADDFHEELRKLVHKAQEESLSELERIRESRWFESHIELLAVQVQHAASLEASRCHKEAQLLTDFYHGAVGEVLPEFLVRPKIDTVAGGNESGSSRFVREVEDSERDASSRWEFPYLDELMAQAQAVACKLGTTVAVPPKEENHDPKSKKASALASPPPQSDRRGTEKFQSSPLEFMPLKGLLLDLQNALLAERLHYLHRLHVLRDWAERRLSHVKRTSSEVFTQLRDWIVLRRRMELNAVAFFIDVIKEHIENEDFIESHLTIEDGHLYRHPNIRLRRPPSPPRPPVLENATSGCWTIEQLDTLLDVMCVLAQTHNSCPSGHHAVPAQFLFTVLLQLTRSPGRGDKECGKPLVPLEWVDCDPESLQSLCHLFCHPPRVGAGKIDCIELLLHICMLNSAAEWPTFEMLLEIRQQLEPLVPEDKLWPDFYIKKETLLILPVFQGLKSSEALHSPPSFDRLLMQLQWVGRVFRSFQAPSCQFEANKLEASWSGYWEGCANNAELFRGLLNEQSLDPRSATPVEVGSKAPVPQSESLSDSAELLLLEDRVSVRQFLSYFCLGSSAEDGLARALHILGSGTGTLTVAEFHSVLLQLGGRPMEFSACGNQPSQPSVEQVSSELGLDDSRAKTSFTVDEFLRRVKQSSLRDLMHRHCLLKLDYLFSETSGSKSP